jgi:hypothetical protein
MRRTEVDNGFESNRIWTDFSHVPPVPGASPAPRCNLSLDVQERNTMMRTRWILPGSVVLCSVILAGPALAQEAQDHEAMMKAYMEKMQPGPAHQMLARVTGDWSYTITSFENPEAPMTMTGSATKKMILDGRYLREEVTGDMMGMPFTGIGITGFDNTTQKYQSIWFDSMSTGMLVSHGEFVEGNTITMFNEHTDAMTGKTIKAKTVTEFVDDNKHFFYWYVLEDDKEIKQMEMEYVRK